MGGKVIVPQFNKNEIARGLVDANDLHVSRGLGEVKRQFGGPALDKTQEKERNTGKARQNAQDKGQKKGLSL